MLDGHRHPAALEEFSKTKSYVFNNRMTVLEMIICKKISKIKD